MSHAQECSRSHWIGANDIQTLCLIGRCHVLSWASKQPPELTLRSLLRSLDREDFKLFVERLTQEMGKPFSIVSELLILSALEVQPLKKSDSAIFQEIQVSKRQTPGS